MLKNGVFGRTLHRIPARTAAPPQSAHVLEQLKINLLESYAEYTGGKSPKNTERTRKSVHVAKSENSTKT